MICSKSLRILIATTLIGGLLATAAPSHTAHRGSEQELVEIASRNLVPEIRAGASLALTWRLTEDCGEIAENVMPILRAGPEKLQALLEEIERIKGPEKEFLEKLEEIATGPTPELRRAAIKPLACCSYPFYLLVSGLSGLLQEQLPIEGLTVEELIASIPEGESFELRLARAIAAVRHLRSANPCELPAAGLVTRELGILQGGSVEFCGFELDGSIPAIREAFLFGTEVFSYRYHSVMDFPSQPGYHMKNMLGCEELMEGSVNGETPQFRAAVASAYVDFFSRNLPWQSYKSLPLPVKAGS